MTNQLRWLDIGNGALSLGPRPGKRTFESLRTATDVVTLLTDEEGALPLKHRLEMMGLRWWHLPLAGGKPFGGELDACVRALLTALAQRLAAGARIYIHCSAGIHRTGMIGAAFLFSLGFDEDEVVQALERMRSYTANGLGSERLAVARRFQAPT